MNFVKQTMNVIDILAIAPYYISLVFEDPNIGLPADEELQQTAAANTTVTEAEVDKSQCQHEHCSNIVSGHRQWRRIRQCVQNSASAEQGFKMNLDVTSVSPYEVNGVPPYNATPPARAHLSTERASGRTTS